MKKFTRILAVMLFTVTLIITQTSCGGVEKVSKSSYYMDTICDITIYDMEDMSEDNANAAIKHILINPFIFIIYSFCFLQR